MRGRESQTTLGHIKVLLVSFLERKETRRRHHDMKFFQKRSVAVLLMALAILAGVALGRAKAPDDSGGGITGSFPYLLNNEGNVISQDSARYIESMNASLFAQTGAQIVVDVVRTTGEQDIADYAEEQFKRCGIGSIERDNGVLLVLALENEHNGVPDGDYYIAWGGGFTASQQRRLDDILWDHMEEGFIVQRYDLAVRNTFDALVDYLEGVYHVKVSTAPAAGADSYTAIRGGYTSTGTSGVLPGVLVTEIVVLLVILLIIWVIADGLRYRSYRRRYWGPTVVGIPRPVYYPIFWGRPRRSRVPPPPRPPMGGGAEHRPGGFHPGGSFGGGAGRRSGDFHPGGSFGGGAGRRSGGFSSGGSFGGGAGRRSGGGIKARPSGGARRSPPPRRSGGGGRRR